MNYIEAVRELVNNPKAVAITFLRGDGNAVLRIQLSSEGKLTFWGKPGKENEVKATSPTFLLREDFTVVYKEEKRYTESQIAEAYHNGFVNGENSAEARADKAFEKFKREWAKKLMES